MRTLFACLLLTFALIFPARAGGSVSLDDAKLKGLLQQQPEVWKFFTDHLEINSHGGGSRLSGPDYLDKGDLRGTRVGPYHFSAKPMGSSGGDIFEILIQTDLAWIDDAGREVSIEQATGVRETLVGIELAKRER